MRYTIKMAFLGFIFCLFTVFIFSNPAHAAGTSTSKATGSSSASATSDTSSTNKAPGPSNKMKASARPLLPDLIVERIWLDSQCKIHFQLKNSGTGDIPDNQFRAAHVRLFIGSQKIDFSLSQALEGRPAVDPGGALKQAGGTAALNTAQPLEVQRLVRVWIDNTHQILESKEDNNTSRNVLKPNCPALPASGAIVAAPAISGAAANNPQPINQMQLPHPSIQIISFHRSSGSNPTMVTTTLPGGGGGSSAPADTATIDAGQVVRLSWMLEGCNAVFVHTQLRGWNHDHTEHTSPSVHETRSNRPNNCYRISGYTEVHDMEDRDYVLTVTASSPGAGSASDERTFHVLVRIPRLVMEKPEVDMGALTVKFFVKNKGEADYPSPGAHLTGHYTITNWNGLYTYASGVIYKDKLLVPKGARIEIGQATMTDREHVYAATKILINAQADDQYGFMTGDDRSVSYLHEWETRTTTLGADLLLSFFSALDGEIRLNNYRSPGSNSTSNRPSISGDSFVEIMDERKSFTPEFISAKLKGSASGHVYFDYRPFINNLTATIGGTGTTSIPDKNTVNLKITFNTAGGPEVKGWRYKDNKYIDDDAPDIDLTQLELDVKFHLNKRNGKIVVDLIYIVPSVQLVATDDWSWLLNYLKPWLERMATNQISKYVGDLVKTDDMRDQLNDAIADALNVLGVEWVHDFELTSAGLTMTYIPKP